MGEIRYWRTTNSWIQCQREKNLIISYRNSRTEPESSQFSITNRMNILMIVTMCIMKYHLFFHYVIITYTPTSKGKAMLLHKDNAHWMKKCQLEKVAVEI